MPALAGKLLAVPDGFRRRSDAAARYGVVDHHREDEAPAVARLNALIEAHTCTRQRSASRTREVAAGPAPAQDAAQPGGPAAGGRTQDETPARPSPPAVHTKVPPQHSSPRWAFRGGPAATTG
ncbi:hypothetical protein ACFV7Q_35620 [Streptomyces sp. NPDC059851]|uniref:hypothetical protein n=1 Tax=Streptomyces sp. NPDC059851 TaxID=3346971 RepID=UPI00365497B5